MFSFEIGVFIFTDRIWKVCNKIYRVRITLRPLHEEVRDRIRLFPYPAQIFVLNFAKFRKRTKTIFYVNLSHLYSEYRPLS